MSFAKDRRPRGGVAFAAVFDTWAAYADGLPEAPLTAIEFIEAGAVRPRMKSPRRCTIYSALLGNAQGPVVICKVRGEAPSSADDLARELDEFVEWVDYGELGQVDSDGFGELGDLYGLGDLIDGTFGDRPDWLDNWIQDLPGGGSQPREPDKGQGRPGFQGSGRPRRPGPSDPLGAAHGSSEAERLRDAWGIDRAPTPSVGPMGGQGLAYNSAVLGIGWGSDDATEMTEAERYNEQAAITAGAAGVFALIAVAVPAPPIKVGAGVVAAVYAIESAFYWYESNRAAVRERQNAAKRHTPDPEEGAGTIKGIDARRLGARLVGEVVIGSTSGDRRRPRVHFDSEWIAGTSYGWTRFGAPRASENYLPTDSSMPSDTSEESPTIWLGATTSTSGSTGDDWIVAKGNWGWNHLGAPRARQ